MQPANTLEQNTTRIIVIDQMRGIAVLLMVVYHLFFDLSYFNHLELDLNGSPYWRAFRYLIVSLFTFTTGIALHLSHVSQTRRQIHWQKVTKRIIQLGTACILVTAMSLYLFPDNWIYFGILHFILFASLVLLPLRNAPITALILGFLIIVAHNLGWLNLHPLFQALQPILSLPERSEDVVPIFPWLAPVLFGIYVAHYQLHRFHLTQPSSTPNQKGQKGQKEQKEQKGETKQKRQKRQYLTFIGKHALIIYLIHQPALFILFIAFAQL